MVEVTVREAEANLAEMVQQALDGELVIIEADQEHAVRLVPVEHRANAQDFSNELIASMDDREFNHYLG